MASRVFIPLAVGLGSGTGGVLRYGLGGVFQEAFPQSLVWGILLANILGCFFIGVAGARYTRPNPPGGPIAAAFIIPGFCGGLTTVSLFSRQSLELWLSGDRFTFAILFLVSLLFCLLATYWGKHLFESKASPENR